MIHPTADSFCENLIAYPVIFSLYSSIPFLL